MIDLLSEDQLDAIREVGILTISIPYPYYVDGTMEEQSNFAVAYIKSNYNLNWKGSALLVGMDVGEYEITLKLINIEVLQIILVDTGLGAELYNEFHSLLTSNLN